MKLKKYSLQSGSVIQFSMVKTGTRERIQDIGHITTHIVPKCTYDEQTG